RSVMTETGATTATTQAGFTLSGALARALELFKQNLAYCLVVSALAELVSVAAAAVLTANLGAGVVWLMQLDTAPPETWLSLFLLTWTVVHIPVDLIVAKIFLLLSGGRRIAADDVLSFDVGFYAPLALRLFLSAAVYNVSVAAAMV